MISGGEPESGPSNHHVLYSTPALGATFAGKKRKRTDTTTSPRSPKRVAAGVDDDQPLQYIDVSPSASTSASTPSLPPASLPQSPSPVPDPDSLLSTSGPVASLSQPCQPSPSPHTPDLLSEYTCPICFSQPSNATLTPCGHICCGSCLFTAVKTTLHRGAMGFSREPNVARCPVCRSPIPGWDGRGGGVIGLKARVVISL